MRGATRPHWRAPVLAGGFIVTPPKRAVLAALVVVDGVYGPKYSLSADPRRCLNGRTAGGQDKLRRRLQRGHRGLPGVGGCVRTSGTW